MAYLLTADPVYKMELYLKKKKKSQMATEIHHLLDRQKPGQLPLISSLLIFL